MALLSQIMGASYGRPPVTSMPPVHMPPLPSINWQQRPIKPDRQSAENPNGQDGIPDHLLNRFMRQQGAAPADPAAAAATAANPFAGNGIMGSIMQAFGGGYGGAGGAGGLDPQKLLAMLGMVGG
jgi:hypothetical protein